MYSNHTDDGLMLEMSASWSFYGGNFIIINLLDTLFSCSTTPPTQHTYKVNPWLPRPCMACIIKVSALIVILLALFLFNPLTAE